MATISGCQNITAWLEESPVISDTAPWQGAVLAIHSHHPVIIITSDIIINQTVNWPCAACLTLPHTHMCKKSPPMQVHKLHTHT